MAKATVICLTSIGENCPPSERDVALTPRGHQQAHSVAQWLFTNVPNFDVIYCSTLRRTKETVVPFTKLYNCPVIYDHRLREFTSNKRAGSPFPNDDLPGAWLPVEKVVASYKPRTAKPDSESYIHMRARLGEFLSELIEKHQEETVGLIAHGMIANGLLDHVFNVGLHRVCEVWAQNCSVTHVEYLGNLARQVWRLHSVGVTVPAIESL